jgi:hypothetical protein
MQLNPLAVTVSLIVLACGQAQAQSQQGQQGQPGQQGQEREGRRHLANESIATACKADIKQLCQGETGQAAEQCLRNNSEKLSSQCKGAITKPPQN